MPVAPKSRLYKTFPPSFAEGVTQHVQRRAELYRTDSATYGKSRPKNGLPQCATAPATATRNLSRPVSATRPLMSPLVESRESDTSPRSCEPSPRFSSQPPQHSIPGNTRSRRKKTSNPSTSHSRLARSMHFVGSPRVAGLSSQPTSVSLDDVDLWESDSEQNETQNSTELEETQESKDDANAHKRLLEKRKSAAALRKSSSGKPVCGSNLETCTVNQVSMSKESAKQSNKSLENINKLENSKILLPKSPFKNQNSETAPYSQKPKDQKSEIMLPEKSDKKPSNHISSLYRHEDMRRTYCLFSSKSEKNNSGIQKLNSRFSALTDRKPSKSPTAMEVSDENLREGKRTEESPREGKRTFRQASSDSMETLDSSVSPRCDRSSKETSPRVWNSLRSQKSPVPMDSCFDNKFDTKRIDLRSSNERILTKSPMLVDGDSNDSAVSSEKLIKQKSAFEQLKRRSTKTPVPMDTEQLEHVLPVERRVKFNNLVKVHDDQESCTLDVLRDSINSAQRFKSLYLVKANITGH